MGIIDRIKPLNDAEMKQLRESLRRNQDRAAAADAVLARVVAEDWPETTAGTTEHAEEPRNLDGIETPHVREEVASDHHYAEDRGSAAERPRAEAPSAAVAVSRLEAWRLWCAEPSRRVADWLAGLIASQPGLAEASSDRLLFDRRECIATEVLGGEVTLSSDQRGHLLIEWTALLPDQLPPSGVFLSGRPLKLVSGHLAPDEMSWYLGEPPDDHGELKFVRGNETASVPLS